MIWTLRIECVRGRYLNEDWIRVVELDCGSSLYDLHQLIQTTIGFDQDHLFEFFAGRSLRKPSLRFGDGDDFDDSGADWDELALQELFPLPKNLKLYYHFDFGDDWYFEIRKQRTKPKPPEGGVTYPRVIEATGSNPRQYGR